MKAGAESRAPVNSRTAAKQSNLTEQGTSIEHDEAFSQQPSLIEDDVAILELCQKTSSESSAIMESHCKQSKQDISGQSVKKGTQWANLIRQRLGLNSSKNKQQNANEKSQTYDNSCGSLGLSIERDLIGNLLTPDEQSIDDEILANQS